MPRAGQASRAPMTAPRETGDHGRAAASRSPSPPRLGTYGSPRPAESRPGPRHAVTAVRDTAGKRVPALGTRSVGRPTIARPCRAPTRPPAFRAPVAPLRSARAPQPRHRHVVPRRPRAANHPAPAPPQSLLPQRTPERIERVHADYRRKAKVYRDGPLRPDAEISPVPSITASLTRPRRPARDHGRAHRAGQ